jgi:hypothetical protein
MLLDIKCRFDFGIILGGVDKHVTVGFFYLFIYFLWGKTGGSFTGSQD